jgi:hypothetical protein
MEVAQFSIDKHSQSLGKYSPAVFPHALEQFLASSPDPQPRSRLKRNATEKFTQPTQLNARLLPGFFVLR